MLRDRNIMGALVGLLIVAGATPAAAEDDEFFRLYGVAELGFVGVLDHKIQLDRGGSAIDYLEDGGQDNLFFNARLSVEAELARRHRLIFLYQPLDLVTRNVPTRDLTVDGATFPAGTPMEFRYGFPFYRLGYLYDFIDGPRHEVSLGGSLQIRNATIEFRSLDGTIARTNHNIGPVPLIKFRARYGFESGFWLGTEVDGMYAPISVLNGSRTDTIGALVDASVRGGYQINARWDVFANLRYIGGGSVGDSDDSAFGDGYTKNWIHLMALTLGVSARVF
jgi:hypothetical protein